MSGRRREWRAAEQEALRRAHGLGEPLSCPSCRTPLDGRRVTPNPSVAYVRRRLLVTCPACRAHMVLDDSEDR